MNQFDVGLFDRAERDVPSIRLVPGKLREIGAERVILKIPASAGENFVANNDELICGKALKLFGRQIPATGIREGDAILHFRLGRDRPRDAAGRGSRCFDRLNQADVGLFDRAERDVPSMRLVPGKLREVGAQCVILKVPASAGENFVASNVKPIGGCPLQFGAGQIPDVGVREEKTSAIGDDNLSDVRRSLIDRR